MAETTADVRRDIELTRERVSNTLAQLERKMNLAQIVRDNPWPAVGVAIGAGLLLSGSRADVKAAAATAVATKGAGARLAPALDDIVARLMHEVTSAFHGHVDTLLDQVKDALGAPSGGFGASRGFADVGHGSAHGAGVGAAAASPSHAGAGTPHQADVTNNPWNTALGDRERTGAPSDYTPSTAGSQQMHGQ